jgi:hypothetical protein
MNDDEIRDELEEEIPKGFHLNDDGESAETEEENEGESTEDGEEEEEETE